MKIQETTKNGPRPNIDTPLVIRVKTEHKTNSVLNGFSRTVGSNWLDKDKKEAYYDNREDFDRLAKEWIELVLKQVMERPN